MSKPKLLDLFCCAGGAAMGYHKAGFEVLGVDLNHQPHYPFPFIQSDFADLSDAFLAGFEFIHASPPCQSFTAYRRKGFGVGDGYPDLINPVRERLQSTGSVYVIENVEGAPLFGAVKLCGSMFGLDVRRHRYFESNVALLSPSCNHASQIRGRFPGATNRSPMSRATVEIGVWRIPLTLQKHAMGIDWEVSLEELSEAIPPAFTEFLGRQILQMRAVA